MSSVLEEIYIMFGYCGALKKKSLPQGISLQRKLVVFTVASVDYNVCPFSLDSLTG